MRRDLPRVKKARGPTKLMADDVEMRKMVITQTGLEHTSSNTVYFDCPFCGTDVKAYVWSLCGGGKRCTCGAMFTGSARAFHFKDVDHKVKL